MPLLSAPSLPSAARWLAEMLFHVQRLGYCHGSKEQLATQANYFSSYMAGVLLSCFCKKHETVRWSARIVMVAQRAIAAAKAQAAFAKSISALLLVWQIDELMPPVKQPSLNHWHFVPVSDQIRLSYKLGRIVEMIKKTVLHLLDMLFSLLQTSSSLHDLARALQGDEEALDQGIREIFINCMACTGDSLHIVEELRAYEVTIHRLLRFLGASHEVELVTERALDGCRTAGALCAPFQSIAAGIQKIMGFESDAPSTTSSSLLTIGKEPPFYDKLLAINTQKR